MIRFKDLSLEDKVRFLSDVKYFYISYNINSPRAGLCHAISCVWDLWDFDLSGCCGDVEYFMGSWWLKLAKRYGMKSSMVACRLCEYKSCPSCLMFEGFWWPISDISARVQFINVAINYIISNKNV